MPSYVYSRVNKENGKFYIGKANNPKRRWAEEDRQKILKKGINSALESAIKKYGSDSFDNYIIAKCKDANEAYRVEEELITICRCVDTKKLYNITNGGEGLGSGEDHPCYGKHRSEESRAKQSKARKGIPNTKEHNLNISKGLKGKPKAKEHVRKIADAHIKPYARIIKCGTRKGKQYYSLVYKGNIYKYSVFPDRLKLYAQEHNLPLEKEHMNYE